MKKKTLFIVLGIAVLAIAVYFLFFRKNNKKSVDASNVTNANVDWILNNFTAKQINTVQGMWDYCQWIASGPNSGTAELAAQSSSSEEQIAENYSKLSFATAAAWCTDAKHAHAENTEVINSAQAKAIKAHGITADDWAAAYNQAINTLM